MNKRKASSSSWRPSFFKVLIHYTTKLRLPPVFVRNFGEFLPKIAKLRTISGEKWDVRVKEEICDDDDDDKRYLCFVGGGWAKFVNDLDLKFGEFLVFFLNVNESTIDVSVYGTHCCERPFSAVDVDSDADCKDFELKNDCDNVPDDCKRLLRRRKCIPESEGAAVIERPHFKLLLQGSRKWRWCIPKKFLEAANLTGKRAVMMDYPPKKRYWDCIPKKFLEAANLTGKRAVVMEYPPKKRYWAVILDTTARSGKSVDVSKGWSEFREENGLMEGKTYSFEFNPTKNVIEVKEHK